MFLEHFHLREQPFGVTPNPRYFYASPGHVEALGALDYSIQSNLGFAALVAEPGLGKTTLLFSLLQRYREAARTALVFTTQCTSVELLRYLAAELEAPSAHADPVLLHGHIRDVLVREARRGRRVLVIFDEAQNLSDPVLETVRLLSDFETPETKLLHIVLAGQPPLGSKLERPQLAQLRQRVATVNRLSPLRTGEVGPYVEHRLAVAGYRGAPIFSTAALDVVGEASEGVPRTINRICFNALTAAWRLQRRTVDEALVSEAVAGLNPGPVGGSGEWETGVASTAAHVAANHGEKSVAPSASRSAAAAPSPAMQPAVPSPPPAAREKLAAASPVNSGSARSRDSLWAHTQAAPQQAPQWATVVKWLPAAVVSTAMLGLVLYLFAGERPVNAVPVTGGGATFTEAPPPEQSAGIAHAEDPDGAEPMIEFELPETASIAAEPAPPASTQSAPALAEARRPGAAEAPAATLIEPVVAVRLPSAVPERQNSIADQLAPQAPPAVWAQADEADSMSRVLTAALPPGRPLPRLAAPAPRTVSHRVSPHYPRVAQDRRLEGVVVLEALVGADGAVRNVRVISGSPILAAAAVEAVTQWRYEPQADAASAPHQPQQIEVRFSLPR